MQTLSSSSSSQFKYKIGFIGAGNMAMAIVKSLLISKRFTINDILVCDPLESQRTLFSEAYKVQTSATNHIAYQNCKLIVLSIKPQIFPKLGCPDLSDDQTIISIMAGISTDVIKSQFKLESNYLNVSLYRIMPNTPLLIGKGFSAIFPSFRSTPTITQNITSLFNIGENTAILVSDEAKLHSITAISGCGPAYLFWIAEIMEEMSTNLGLDPSICKEIVSSTLLGASTLLKNSSESAKTLKQRVASKGGCTERALEIFEPAQQILKQGIEGSYLRSKELAGEVSEKIV